MAGQPVSRISAGGSAPALHHRSELEIEHPEQHAAPGAANLSRLTCIRCGASYPASIEIDSKGCPACRDIAPANLKPVYAAPVDGMRLLGIARAWPARDVMQRCVSRRRVGYRYRSGRGLICSIAVAKGGRALAARSARSLGKVRAGNPHPRPT